ncbi:MAG: VanZ family protein [Acidimicrobiales bacterium]|nr:VanZ family protein [Acidimicrobiales bacterium]
MIGGVVAALLGPLDYMFGETLRVAVTVAIVLAVLMALGAKAGGWGFERAARNWLFLTGVAAIVLFTQHSPYEGTGRVLDLTPFGDLKAARISVHRRDLVLANIALFMPLGAALAWRGTRFVKTVAVGVVLSVGAEALQYIGGNGRIAQLEDLIYNTFGTGLGWILAAACLWLARGSLVGRTDVQRA